MSHAARNQPTTAPDRLCLVCNHVPVFDRWTLCKDCSDDLWAELLKVTEPPRDRRGHPGRTLVDELRLTVASCDRIAARNLGITVRSASTSLPWKERASAALANLYYVLRCWASTTAGCSGIHEELLTNAEEAAEWLLRRFNRVRVLDIADQAHEQIIAAIHQAEWAIDRPADRAFAGPCSVEDEETGETCCGEVYVRPGTDIARCNKCSAEYAAAERRDWLLQKSEDYLVTAAEASRALPDLLGRPLSVKTVRTWHNTGRLAMHGRDRDNDELDDVDQPQPVDRRGAPLHRLGDIVQLALTTATRERKPKRHAAAPADAGAAPPLCA